MFDVLPARVLEPLDRELFELVFGDHLESNVNTQGLTQLILPALIRASPSPRLLKKVLVLRANCEGLRSRTDCVLG